MVMSLSSIMIGFGFQSKSPSYLIALRLENALDFMLPFLGILLGESIAYSSNLSFPLKSLYTCILAYSKNREYLVQSIYPGSCLKKFRKQFFGISGSIGLTSGVQYALDYRWYSGSGGVGMSKISEPLDRKAFSDLVKARSFPALLSRSSILPS